MLWLGILCVVLAAVIVLLLIKIALLRQAAEEIREEFAGRLECDTNTLITISSHDAAMRRLADSINGQLRELRRERHRFWQGDFELKEAVTNISHDLRTPLTAICGYLDLLAREETSKDAQRYLEVIKNRTEVLKQLTEELFRYSVFMTTSKDATYENVSLNGALEESISAYYAALKGCGITPKIMMPQQEVCRRLNRNALVRIIGNILGNAIKYSDGDLRIELLDSGEMVFTNHASKLDETQVGKLFDRFYTVEAAAKSTGLGLSIAKMLTEQMNGKISAFYAEGNLSIHLMFGAKEDITINKTTLRAHRKLKE